MFAPLSSDAKARTDRLAPRYKARPGQYWARPAGGAGASQSDLRNATAQPQRPQEQLGGYWRARRGSGSRSVAKPVSVAPFATSKHRNTVYPVPDALRGGEPDPCGGEPQLPRRRYREWRLPPLPRGGALGARRALPQPPLISPPTSRRHPPPSPARP